MTSEVRFREKAEAGYAARIRKLMPACFPKWPQLEVGNDLLKQCAKDIQIAQRLRATPLRVDDPFNPNHIHEGPLLLSVPAFGTELARSRN